MSRVVFWDYGHGGSAELTAAAAVYMATAYPQRVLLVNEALSGTGVEGGMVRYRDTNGADNLKLSEYGMDALLRLTANQRLMKVNIADYTTSVIRGKLDLVAGRSLANMADLQAMEQQVERMYSVAEEVYDLVFTRPEINGLSRINAAESVSEKKMIGIVTMHQNRQELERFFEEYAAQDTGASYKTDAIVLRHYDSRSHWTVSNIRRRFNCDLPMYGIPYSTRFNDAWNNTQLVRYIRLYWRMTRSSPDQEVLTGLSKLTAGLLELLDRCSLVQERGKGA